MPGRAHHTGRLCAQVSESATGRKRILVTLSIADYERVRSFGKERGEAVGSVHLEAISHTVLRQLLSAAVVIDRHSPRAAFLVAILS